MSEQNASKRGKPIFGSIVLGLVIGVVTIVYTFGWLGMGAFALALATGSVGAGGLAVAATTGSGAVAVAIESILSAIGEFFAAIFGAIGDFFGGLSL